ncbi:hypothetical protein PSH03_005404 [Micromonospora sp. PSH03]|uniref:hypothetical protein n=1 Tax=Micromonospora salmantinae TaxID=2911211 RepID=UPI001EE9734F|nr:hypothetical protein [Micromonospora salmantinae]MCG5459620.1 hypothetical protein [Micromonospora salmantinae]
MSKPLARFEVAFRSNISDPAPKWEDVSEYVKASDIRLGRTYELDRIEAGTASFELDNADGRFTPGRYGVRQFNETFGALASPVSAPTGSLVDFTVDSGVWTGVNTRATGATVEPIPGGGVRVVTTATITSQNIKVARYITPGPGVTVRVTARARAFVTAPADGATDVYFNVYHRDAAEAPVLPTIGTTANFSGGEWRTLTAEFTMPTLAEQPTYAKTFIGITGRNSAPADNEKPLSLEVAYVQLEIAGPHAHGIKPRKPARIYTVHDDNWLHYESVNPVRADLDRARINAWNGTVDGVSIHASPSQGRDIWRFARTNGGVQWGWFCGINDASDWVRVTPGQLVTFTGDIGNAAGFSASPTIRLVVSFRSDATGAFGGVSYSTPYTDTAIHSASVSWVATGAGYIRAGVICDAPDANIGAYGFNFKLRLDGVGTPTVGAVSGKYPAFSGFIEKWTQEFDGVLSTVTAQCVDASKLLSQPLKTTYRAAVHNWWKANVQGTTSENAFWYWPCVEASENVEASPEIAGLSYPLTISSTIEPSGSTYGFTTDKTMVYSDGENSGGFTATGTDPAPSDQGGALKFVFGSRPSLPSSNSYTVDFWYRPQGLPVNPYGQSLFNSKCSDSWAMSGRITWASIRVIDFGGAQRLLFVARSMDGESVETGLVGPALARNQIYHVGMRVAKNGSNVTIYAYIDGALVGSDTMVVTDETKLIPPINAEFMAEYAPELAGVGKGYYQPARGTMNHIVVGFDIPAGFHAAVHPFGDDIPELDTARLTRVLDAAGWQGGRILDAARSVLLPARWDAGADAFGVIQDAAESAGGYVYIAAAGEIAYHNRTRRMGAPVRWPVAEWTDGVRFEVDEARIYNVIRAERVSGLFREARDEASIAEYGPKGLTVRRDVNDPAEVANAATWLLHRYGEPAPRCDTLRVEAHTLNGDGDSALIGLAYGAALSDRLMLSGLPPEAPADQMDFFVEGLSISIERDGDVWRWVTDLSVSDAQRSEAWVLEDETSGYLDTESCVVIY